VTFRISAVCLLAVTLFAAVTLCAADRRPIPWERRHLLIGQALYRENCVVCHDIDRPQSKKAGPSFYQLFKRDKMPLGNLKPSREYIKVRVKFGGALMPAFRQTLTESEIDTLIDYIAAK
jgi:mono/diheme cytochrome c family protein